MEPHFYADLSLMVNEALEALNRFDGTSNELDAFRAIPGACLEGEQLLPSIRSDLGPRRVEEFQSAALQLRRASNILHAGGIGNNPGVHNLLARLGQISAALQREAETRATQLVIPRVVPAQNDYVSSTRVSELRALVGTSRFDLTRLIRMVEELNLTHSSECYIASAMLIRAITDHVPPVFGLRNFAEVANNYAGSRSFKGSMQHLQNSLRPIADGQLHVQMRQSDSLPTERQVDFGPDLDVLLSEVARVMRS
jgi:hypothetical protein